MTDIASIIPDTATVPVAEDLVHPERQQNGHELPVEPVASPVDSVSSRRSVGMSLPSDHVLLNNKVRSESLEKETVPKQNGLEPLSIDKDENPVKPRTSILSAAAALVEVPLKGPRNGIHWGAGQPLARAGHVHAGLHCL